MIDVISLAITDSENTFVQRKVRSPSTTPVLDKEMVTNQTGKLKPLILDEN